MQWAKKNIFLLKYRRVVLQFSFRLPTGPWANLGLIFFTKKSQSFGLEYLRCPFQI